jgi:hypothetical protein
MKLNFAAALFAATAIASSANAATLLFTIRPVLGTNGQPLRTANGSGDGRSFSFTITDAETPSAASQGLRRPTYRMKSYTFTEFGSSTIVTVPATLGKNVDFFGQIDQGGIGLTNSGNRNFRLLNTVLYDDAAYRAAIVNNPNARPVFKLGTFALSTEAWNQTPINPKPRPLDNYTVTITAIPEPASWAMMIGGFSFVGAAMRRRATSVRFA